MWAIRSVDARVAPTTIPPALHATSLYTREALKVRLPEKRLSQGFTDGIGALVYRQGVQRHVHAALTQAVQQLHRVGSGKPHGAERFHLGEHLRRSTVYHQLAVVHDDETVGVHGLVHMVGDEHHGDAPLLI